MRYPTTDNLTCVICGESALEMLGFDINFNKVTKKGFNICFECARKTDKLLKEIKKISLAKVPFYINHENVFVRGAAIKRLRDNS